MSADIWLDPDPGGDCCGPSEEPTWKSAHWEDHHINLTYNLSPMLREAGFPGWDSLTGAPCSEVGGMLLRVATTLVNDPERFKKLNPENGWGTYEQAVGAMFGLAVMCKTHPECFFVTGL